MVNVSSLLRKTAQANPYKKAVIYPAGRDKNGRVAYAHLTFRQLEKESDLLAHGLERTGITRGTKTVLMVKPGLEFFALTFALFKTGAVPVIVDPGMGIQRMISCYKDCRPEGFIGIPLAHMVRTLYPGFFKTVNALVTVGRRWFWGGNTYKQLIKAPWEPYSIAETKADETAAILFTTGSTGPAKGVIYTHGTFDAQIRYIKEHFHINPGEIDLPTFPLFALFDPALEMTAVIPDMNPTKPAMVNPEKIIEAINDHGVTNMFASPALLNRVGAYGSRNNIKLPSLKRIISAGAPVPVAYIKRFSSMLSENAGIHTPYGATEAMPVLSIYSNEILNETGKLGERGYGICIGRPVCGLDVRIIQISDASIENWSDDILVASGETGEIAVRGDVVTRNYYKRPEEEALSKIRDGETVWHRMGDLGWMDSKGRVWFCGRKSHRVVSEDKAYFTVPCEAIFNNHSRVFRSALVGIGKRPHQTPVICIELKDTDNGKNIKGLKKELYELAGLNEMTQDIENILFHKSFPVDIRHNAKIFREKLAIWAARQLL